MSLESFVGYIEYFLQGGHGNCFGFLCFFKLIVRHRTITKLEEDHFLYERASVYRTRSDFVKTLVVSRSTSFIIFHYMLDIGFIGNEPGNVFS